MPIAPVPITPGPSVPPGTPGLYVLHVIMWDLHAARALARRLHANGVRPQSVHVRGRRCDDGVQEAEFRPRRRLTTRWRLNMVVAVTAAVVVGIPMGASLATMLLGEHAVVAWVGAAVGGGGLAAIGTTAVWADHLQRTPGSRNASRVEGHLVVTDSGAVVRAEMLLGTTPDVMDVRRLPPASADPLDW